MVDDLELCALVELAQLYDWPPEKIRRLMERDENMISEAKALEVPLGVFMY